MSELVPVCFRCGTGLIWNGSDEWGDEENGGNREYYVCPHCGNDYEVCEIPENQKDDFEYWIARKNPIGGGKKLNILVACEESQTICIELRRLGHRAFSCDLVPCSGGHEEWHIQGDALSVIDGRCEFVTQDGKRHFQNDKWDLLIAHPVCTYLTVSAEWCYNVERFGDKAIERMRLRDEAQEFFMRFINADCDHIAVENPVGVMSTRFRKPDQIIQPWYFGDPYMKTTCLWTKNLPLLKQTHFEKPEIRYKEWVDKNGKKKRQDYESYRQSGNKDRSKNRSKTFPGIGKAIAEQYSEYIIQQRTNAQVQSNI